MTTYSESGVDIEKGDIASRIMYEAAKESWQNRRGKIGEVVVPFDDFSGLRAVNISNFPKETFMSMNFDTVGTKSEIAERLNKHDTIAFDLFAMVCDDAVVRGGEPILIGSNLEINKIDIDIIRQLAKGYVAAAKEANVAIINGEIAEVGARVNGASGLNKCSYNWGATALWISKKESLITGKEVKVGDSLVAFKEDGFRSNGLSLVRRIMEKEWTKETLSEALTPSKIYTKAMVAMFGKFNGAAHITGGGIPGKVGRMLKPSGLGASFDNLFEPPKFTKECIERGKVPIDEAYRTWNMGNGMIVATERAEEIIEIAKKYNISAQVCGKIIKEKQIEIRHNANKMRFKL